MKEHGGKITMTLQLSSAQKRRIFLLLFLIPFLLGAGVDLYVPSLPAIGRYFHVPAYLVQFTVGFYMLGYGISQLFLGVLSDSLGRRKILLMSGVLYTLVSFLAVFSISIHMLIICRFLQGCAIAGGGVVCRAGVTDCFTGVARTKGMAFVSTSWGVGPIIGPAIGGYLQNYLDWQANFYFFGIYGLLTFTYAAIFLPETHFQRVPLHPRKIAKTVWGITLHSVFIRYVLIGALAYSALVVFNVIAPFLIQETLHYSAIDYGHIALLMGLGYFSGSFINLGIAHYLSSQKIILISILASIIVTLILLLTGIFGYLNLFSILIPIFFLFFFCGVMFPNIMSMNASLFPASAGTTSAVFGSGVSSGVFVIAMLASLLGTQTQIPLAFMYLGMCVISFVLFFPLRKK